MAAVVICPICSEPCPEHLMDRAGRCEACHWDTYVPQGYEAGERYLVVCPVCGGFWRADSKDVDIMHCERCGYLKLGAKRHIKAVCRPPLGIRFLDEGYELLREQIMKCRRKPRF